MENGMLGNVLTRLFSAVILKDMPSMLKGIDISGYTRQIGELEYHGTTSVYL